MSYRENVEQAAVALVTGENSNWELARLTFENTWNVGDAGRGRPVSSTVTVSMDTWCADVRAASGRRFSVDYGTRYKTIWRRFGTRDIAERPTWTEAMLAVNSTSAEERVVTVTAAQARHSTAHAEPEVKREIFAALARDPDVVQEAAMLGTPTSRAVSELYTKTERVREEHREREVESDPISKRLDQVGAALDLEAACNRFAKDLVAMSERFAREINEALPRTGAAREEHLYWVRQALGRARGVLNELESYAETGRTDLDAFLEGVLGGR